jgi:hypothetical protein
MCIQNYVNGKCHYKWLNSMCNDIINNMSIIIKVINAINEKYEDNSIIYSVVIKYVINGNING